MTSIFKNYFLFRLFLRRFTLLILSVNIFAQAPSIQWQKCLGGSTIDEGYSIKQISDGGYIVAGYTESNNGNVSGLHNTVSNYPDYWIVRLDNLGAIKWQKCLGGSLNDYANCIRQTVDGGFIIAGKSNSNDGDVSGNHNVNDCWIVKLDSSGNIKWQKSYGGTATDEAISIQQTIDGGYIFAGSSLSNNGDVSGNHGNSDCWVVKLDSLGIIKWQKCFGSSGYEGSYSIQQTIEGGYILLGSCGTVDGDVTFSHGGGDYWLVKLDSVGNLKWQKSLGGSNSEIGGGCIQTVDKGYLVIGYSISNDGDVTGNHLGSFDYWVVKTDSLGIIKWQKSLGGSMNDYGSSTLQSFDSGYIVCGFAGSNDGDVTGNHGGRDNWIVKLDTFGSLVWQKCFGGTGDDYGRDIALTSDGGVVITGNTNSNDGDVSGNHGGDDYWVVKLDNVNGIEKIMSENTFAVYPNPSNGCISITSTENITEIKITDVLGQIVYADKPNAQKLNLQIENNGVYFVTVTSGNKSTTQKLIVTQ